MTSILIILWQIGREKVETVADFMFLGFKITTNSDYSHEIQRYLLLGRRSMTNLDHILESRNIITLLLLLSCFSRVDSVRPHKQQPTRLPIPGTLQARTLEWVAISFSNA